MEDTGTVGTGAPNDSADAVYLARLDYIHERVLAELDAQESRWRDIDDRLRLILGVIGIVLAVGAGFVRSSMPAFLPSPAPGSAPATIIFLPFWVGTSVIVAVILYLIAGGMVAWAYQFQGFDRPIRPARMGQYLLRDGMEAREAKEYVVGTIIQAYSLNQDIINAKVAWFNRAFLLTGVATGVLGTGVVAQLAFLTIPW